ncbi:DUF4153 domain-containing protein [Kitasatospora cinereorecta]|uniref:DUF4153 domain-containing protein n=1 Tax=Kitasatospora cinereorecta TaxID=285560 RepID=A0ABW0V7B9_9ACTN
MSSPSVPSGPSSAGSAGAGGVKAPAGVAGPAGANPYQWRPPLPPPEAAWSKLTRARPAEEPRLRVVAAAAGAGLLSAALYGDGVGVNLLLCALGAATAAALVAMATGRRARPWTLAFAASALALTAVPAVSDGGWETALALIASVAVASLTLHGGRRWAGVLLGTVGLWAHLVPGAAWAVRALRSQHFPARGKVVPVAKAVGLAAVLLILFGSLFAGADSTVADLLESLIPSMDLGDFPVRVVYFVVGTGLALAAAHTAAAPRRWDRLEVPGGRERGRLEWAIPLVAMNLLFGGFVLVQLVVLIGGYGAIMRRTGMTPAEYARQGFWQLLWVAVLTLVVVAFAKFWAPRSNDGDRRLVKIMLGLLCVLTLVVVATALVRMSLYLDAFGLSQQRLAVAAMEIWLGVVFLLVLAGGVLAARSWLPRAVVLSGALALAVFGLIRPDAMVAEQNVARFEQSHTLDIGYLRGLSADAVPALDRLPGDYRTCSLQLIAASLADQQSPWYATSFAESRARQILHDRPVAQDRGAACLRVGYREDPYRYGD